MQSSTADAAIQVGPLEIRFLVEAEQSHGSLTMFECAVPAGAKVPAPHSHDGFVETIYGLGGVTTWTVGGETIELGAGEAVCVPRGVVHGFTNHGADARFLAVATPGVFGPAYFRELSDVIAGSAGGPPDPEAMLAVMRRHGLSPVQPAGI